MTYDNVLFSLSVLCRHRERDSTLFRNSATCGFRL